MGIGEDSVTDGELALAIDLMADSPPHRLERRIALALRASRAIAAKVAAMNPIRATNDGYCTRYDCLFCRVEGNGPEGCRHRDDCAWMMAKTLQRAREG